MSDVNASLPIQSISDGNSVKVSKDTSANTSSNAIFIAITDGSGNAVNVTSNALNVTFPASASIKIWDGTDSLEVVVIDSAYGATPGALPIAGKFESSPTTYANGDATPFLTDANGRLIVNVASGGGGDNVMIDDSAFTVATSKVGAIGFFANETTPDSVNEGDIGAPRMTLDRKVLTRIVGATDSFRWDINTNGNGPINIAEQTLTAVKISKDSNANASANPIFVDISAQTLTAIKISKDANANSLTNPIFVANVDTTATAPKHTYVLATAVGTGLTGTGNYPVTAGKTFALTSVIFTASGAGKVEVQVGPVATLVTKAVGFISSANPFVQLDFNPPILITEAGGTEQVKVILKNRDNQTQDLYATIIGDEY